MKKNKIYVTYRYTLCGGGGFGKQRAVVFDDINKAKKFAEWLKPKFRIRYVKVSKRVAWDCEDISDGHNL